jgi:hypothetical protein
MAALLIEDLVSRKWLTEIVSAEQTSTQVELAFTAALDREGLLEHVSADMPTAAIRDPATLRAEPAIAREHYNGVRLHQRIGYVCPNDEHEGQAEAIGKARQAGLEQARLSRLAWHRQHQHDQATEDPDDVG